MIKTISLVIPFNKEKGLSIWLQIRKSKDLLNGLLEFPGGKIESKEEPIEAAIREFEEEVGVIIKKDELSLLKIHTHSSDSKQLFYIYGFHCDTSRLSLEGWNHFSNQNLDSYRGKIPSENLIFLKDIIRTL